MSEETGQQVEQPKSEKKKPPFMPILIVLGIMLLEGGAILLLTRPNGGPSPAMAVDTAPPRKQAAVEVALYEGRLSNSRSGKKVVLELEAYATVDPQFEQDVKETVTRHAAELAHDLGTLVSKLDLTDLYTINSEVLSRQVHTLYDKKVQEDKGDEVSRIEQIVFKKYDPQDVGY
jgi:hypothetical protein